MECPLCTVHSGALAWAHPRVRASACLGVRTRASAPGRVHPCTWGRGHQVTTPATW